MNLFKTPQKRSLFFILFVIMPLSLMAQKPLIVYITPGLDVAFWRYVSAGVENIATKSGYKYQVLDSANSPQNQFNNISDALARDVAGIVLSPTDSSTAPKVLRLAKQNNVPVVIADIGTDSGDYVSFIISDNYRGAYGVGKELAKAMKSRKKHKGSVGIVAISQARKNGQQRTKGFQDALALAQINKSAGMKQMQAYTASETFRYTQDMITANPQMTAIFVQTDGAALGALRAIKAARLQGEILLAAFDGIPEFVPLLESGEIIVSGMQQPYLMGQESAKAMTAYLKGKTPKKTITVPILVVTNKNIRRMLPVIRKTVFANQLK